jgi:multidrug efflux system outer membrane protein
MVVAPLHSLGGGNLPTFERTLIQSQLGVQYVVYDGGATGSRVRAAEATRGAAEVVSGAAEMRVLEETATAYLSVATARTLLQAAQAQVTALLAERERVERHLEAGSAARVELLTAEAVLQEARAEEASAVARVGLAERSLARLMGVDAADLAMRALVPVVAGDTPSAGTEPISPVVREAEQAVAVAEARLAEERAGRLPTVQAGASLLDYGAWEREHALEWRAGVELSWPLFTGSRSAGVRRASSEVIAARGELAAARLQAAEEVDQASTAVATADARAAALAAAVAQWEEVARIESLALDAGAGEQRDLLRAEAGLFQARASHAQALQETLASRLRLARAEGVLSRTWITAWMEDPS